MGTVKEMVEKQKQRINLLAKATISELCHEVLTIAATPVDTGQFMANMRPSIGQPDNTVTQETDPDGLTTWQRVTEKINELKLGDKFYLTNSLPYGPFLEYGLYQKLSGFPRETQRTVNGFSTQAPAGMFRVSVAKWPQIVATYAPGETMGAAEARSISQKSYIEKYPTVFHPQILENQMKRTQKGKK